jgi:hypothetical protein
MPSPIDALGGLGFDVPQAARQGDLGQEDFLQLMLTQLKKEVTSLLREIKLGWDGIAPAKA